MNRYVKDGKRFLLSVKEYFDEYQHALGGDGNLFCRSAWDTKSLMPNPNKIISGMSHFEYPEGYILPLTKCGTPGFDGYFVIGDGKEGITDKDLTVFNSKTGSNTFVGAGQTCNAALLACQLYGLASDI